MVQVIARAFGPEYSSETTWLFKNKATGEDGYRRRPDIAVSINNATNKGEKNLQRSTIQRRGERSFIVALEEKSNLPIHAKPITSPLNPSYIPC